MCVLEADFLYPVYPTTQFSYSWNNSRNNQCVKQQITARDIADV